MFRSDPLLPPKASTIPLVLKNALSRVATSTEMIDRILKLYPKGTRHPTLLPKFSSQCQMFRFDPTQTPSEGSTTCLQTMKEITTARQSKSSQSLYISSNFLDSINICQ